MRGKGVPQHLGNHGGQKEPRPGRRLRASCLEDSASVQPRLEQPFSSLSKPAGGTWLDFTKESGVGENSALGKPMATHLLGRATHSTDGETEALGGESQIKQFIREILLEQWFSSRAWVLILADIQQCLETFLFVTTGDNL